MYFADDTIEDFEKWEKVYLKANLDIIRMESDLGNDQHKLNYQAYLGQLADVEECKDLTIPTPTRSRWNGVMEFLQRRVKGAVLDSLIKWVRKGRPDTDVEKCEQ
jgi:hypothetical protein